MNGNQGKICCGSLGAEAPLGVRRGGSSRLRRLESLENPIQKLQTKKLQNTCCLGMTCGVVIAISYYNTVSIDLWMTAYRNSSLPSL